MEHRRITDARTLHYRASRTRSRMLLCSFVLVDFHERDFIETICAFVSPVLSASNHAISAYCYFSCLVTSILRTQSARYVRSESNKS